MFPFTLIKSFIRVSVLQNIAYRANFWIDLLNSLLNLVVSITAIFILFQQITELNGWDLSATLGLVGVYLIVSALRGLFIGPSLEALVGLGQEVWSGNFDFTLLRPINTQFFVTFRIWRLNALLDLFLGMLVIAFAVARSASPVPLWDWLLFGIALMASVLTLYALLLAFSSLVFWSPGFLFTWVFDALFQLARYPVGIYPPALRILLTWIIPVGLITTIPAMALSGKTQILTVFAAVLVAILLFCVATWLFQKGIRKYHSASS